MTLRTEVDPACRLLTMLPVGAPDFLSCTRDILRLASDPAFAPGYGLVCDFRDFNGTPSVPELMELGRLFVSSGAALQYPLAAVVSRPEHESIARLTAATVRVHRGRMEVFTEVEEAEKWLLSLAPGEDDTPSSPEGAAL